MTVAATSTPRLTPSYRNALEKERERIGSDAVLETSVASYWPDGSIKWTAHAIASGKDIPAPFRVEAGAAPKSSSSLRISEIDDAWVIDTGVIRCTLPRHGDILIRRPTGSRFADFTVGEPLSPSNLSVAHPRAG